MAKKPMNSGKEWTDADKRQLKNLLTQNTPTRVMGLKPGLEEDSRLVPVAGFRPGLEEDSPLGRVADSLRDLEEDCPLAPVVDSRQVPRPTTATFHHAASTYAN